MPSSSLTQPPLFHVAHHGEAPPVSGASPGAHLIEAFSTFRGRPADTDECTLINRVAAALVATGSGLSSHIMAQRLLSEADRAENASDDRMCRLAANTFSAMEREHRFHPTLDLRS